MHPLYPFEKTLADINIDSMNVWGKARDIEDTSFGMSTLDDALARVAKVQGRTAIPNPRPEKGSIYRADRSEEHTSELQSPYDLVCRLLLEKKKKKKINSNII